MGGAGAGWGHLFREAGNLVDRGLFLREMSHEGNGYPPIARVVLVENKFLVVMFPIGSIMGTRLSEGVFIRHVDNVRIRGRMNVAKFRFTTFPTQLVPYKGRRAIRVRNPQVVYMHRAKVRRITKSFVVSARNVTVVHVNRFTGLPNVVNVGQPRATRLVNSKRFHPVNPYLSCVFVYLCVDAFDDFSSDGRIGMILYPHVRRIYKGFYFPRVFFGSRLPVYHDFEFRE